MLMRVAHRGARVARRDGASGATVASGAAPRRRVRRRDRRERGIRGPLAPQAVPVSRSRSTRFDEQVLVAWDRLTFGHPELQFIEVAVSDVPEPDDPALAVFDRADAGLPARITVYRWALELRAGSPQRLQGLLQDVLTEQAAVFLGVPAPELDGGYPRV